ncbi:MAG: hypothetical protein GY811_31270 [Myxococcales bacterium]|nr:hypothetical protein [Myxococcales bacterium]
MTELPTMRLLCALTAGLVLAGCGGDNGAYGGNGPDGGKGGGTDAGGSIDCVLTLVPPTDTAIGQAIEVSAQVDGAAFGLHEFTWSVDLGGITQNITELSDPVDRIQFVPSEAGPYRVAVSATVGGLECLSATTTIGVVATGARKNSYRMRVVTASGAPTQDMAVDVYGGSDVVLPVTVLSAGDLVSGTILDSTGAGVPAYIRARLRDSVPPVDYETFSTEGGEFSLTLPDERFDMLIVPQSGTQPATLRSDRTAAEVGTILTLVAPTTIAGRVLDSEGSGVQGARVSLLVDGAKTTEATTAADGAFSVEASGSFLTGLALAPAPGSGMPSLRAEALSGQAVGDTSNVVIRYADPSIVAQVDITNSGGGGAVGARVEWRADVAAAGTVSVDSVESLDGTLRVAATADAIGRVQSNIVARDASIVVHGAGGSEARLLRDVAWATAPISALSLETLLALPVTAEAAGSPLESADVRAVPQGILAPQFGPVQSVTAADGSAAVGVVRGGAYQLQVVHPLAGEVGAFVADAQPATVLGPLVLPGTIVAHGLVHVDSQPAPGAQVRLYCDDCKGNDAVRVHASAVADSTGHFMFRIADPGVDDL